MELARSYLFVPATRPERVVKATTLDTDVVIVDLEDSVGAGEKDAARAALRQLSLSRKIHVRINSLATSEWRSDVTACSGLDFVDAIVVPMVSAPEEFLQLRAEIERSIPLVALVETPRGVQAVSEIAVAGFARLLFGSADYCAEVGASASRELFAYPRSRLVIASLAAGLPGPIDGPTTAIHDQDQLRADLRDARALGMAGKLCIHPSQLARVREVFAATEREREWAAGVVAEASRHGGSVFTFNDQMIDKPIVEQARRILEP